MGGKSSGAPPPDPRLIEAQIRSMGIQDDAIQRILDNSEAMMPLQREYLQFGLDTGRKAYDQSQEDRTWMLGRRAGLSDMQDRMLADARDFDLADRSGQLVDQARADTNEAFSNARAQSTRGLSRMGVNPASGHALAMNNSLALQQATTTTTAANMARAAAREEGYKLTDRATNALAGYPAMGMAASGAGASYGSAGLGMANAGLAGMNSGYSAAGNMAGAMGQNATNMYGAQANYKSAMDRIAADNDPFKTILGAAAGVGTAWGMNAFMPKPSDRRLKTDIVAVGQLDNGLTVYRYRYKAGGPTHIGVMADEVAILKPEAYVRGGAGGGFDAVNYAKL